MEYLSFTRADAPLPATSEELLVGAVAASGGGGAALSDTAQICSCNNVSKQQIVCAIRDKGVANVGEIKSCTKAGTGCGGCLPLVTDILNAELSAMGKTVRPRLCEHFAFTRQELFQIIKIHGYRRFEDVLAGHGSGLGCEICKPTVASVFASLWNTPILEQATLQDTNDRFLANMQRGGLYSVVPRIPGGEITPEKLIVLGEVAKKYNLYTKITGGQRIDLFGARVEQLPDIWEELVRAGFESGHAYGKALRTVKSCVGTTWCRFGVQDSVGFAIRVENRYKGIRAPHKLKSAVSGCIRECAEAQSKDFGIIATEKGWNLYVCGNGGAKPRHADLLAADLDEETLIRYVDRFLMYYISTADRLTRTSVWLEKMEGGIEYLRDVIVNDRLGICDELERQMQHLVDTYHCEWADVVNNPERRERFKAFVNEPKTDDTIEFVTQRGQQRPADWVRSSNGSNAAPAAQPAAESNGKHTNGDSKQRESSQVVRLPLLQTEWVRVAHVRDIPADGGATIRYGKAQIAVFNFASKGEWYASQNMCPHMKDMVLSRGIVGDQNGTPKIACPLHKKTFALDDGTCLSGESYRITTFPVKIVDDGVYLELPSVERVEKLLEPKEPRWQSQAERCASELRSA
jgi:nitrite reductase (NADH) large subunit